jgi:DNA-directed RNA polymerase specialized sigma24 family protein
MNDDAATPIETLIARWMESGEGEDEMLRALMILLPTFRRSLAAEFCSQVVLDVVGEDLKPGEGVKVGDGLDKLYKEIKKGNYSPDRPFGGWCHTVLRNACRDVRRRNRRRRRHEIPQAILRNEVTGFQDLERMVMPEEIEDESATVFGMDRVAAVVADLERSLDAGQRIVFTLATGLAGSVDRPTFERWCRNSKTPERAIEALDRVAGAPEYGRQKRLAEIFGIGEAAFRQRVSRAAERLRMTATVPEFRKWLESRCKPAGRRQESL